MCLLPEVGFLEADPEMRTEAPAMCEKHLPLGAGRQSLREPQPEPTERLECELYLRLCPEGGQGSRASISPTLVSHWLRVARNRLQFPGTSNSVGMWAKWVQRPRAIFGRGVSGAGCRKQKHNEAGRGGALEKA